MGPSFTLRQDHIDAIVRAHREDFSRRLVRYFETREPDLSQGVDLRAFATSTLDMASRHGITEEEGVVWLGTILLAARRAKEPLDWVAPILERRDAATGALLSEEERLLAVHREAEKRGIVAGKEAA